MPYQDVYVKGDITTKGQRECEARYDKIKQVLLEYKRPITLLDIGASEGYFSLRASSDFPCTSIMIEGGPQAHKQALLNDNPNVVVLQHRITADEIRLLSTCEHFDVVLALNVLHHFPDLGVVDHLFNLGDNIIIETPPPSDKRACGQHVIPRLHERLSSLGGVLIGRSTSHVTQGVNRPIWLFQRRKRSISRAYIDAPDHLVTMVSNFIESTYTDKRVTMKGKISQWIPGVNLATYLRLNGVYPSRGNLVNQLEALTLPMPPHGDIRPWNFVLNRELHLIDGYDSKAIYDDAEGIQFTIKALGID